LCHVPAYMFDTNAFNDVLDEKIPLSALAGKRILATRVQKDELSNAKKLPRREALLGIFATVAPEILPGASFLLDIEGAGLDQAEWNDGSGNFDKMLNRLQELDATHKRKKNRDEEELTRNQLRDVSIAETAIKNAAVLVSGDFNLRQVVSEFGGRAVSSTEFLSS
jgi:hypothetical protein